MYRIGSMTGCDCLAVRTRAAPVIMKGRETMAFRTNKILTAVAGGMLAVMLMGGMTAAAEEENLLLNRFIVTESGNRTLVGSYASNEVTQNGWYVTEDDVIYYYYDNGEFATDETVLDDGNTYLFAADGALKTGWQTVGGKRYYYNTEIGTPVYGWFTYLDQLYYIDQNQGKLTGVQEIGGVPYTFDEYGCVVTGMIVYDDGTMYYYDDNAVPATGWMTETEGTYYFDASGAAFGVTEIDGAKYYFSQDGLLQYGWITTENGVYYADENGVLATGAVTIEGKSFYFDENAVMQTGWVAFEEGNRYYNANGEMLTGMRIIEDAQYYFDGNGLMQTGDQTIGGKRYLFDENGVMQTGWLTKGLETRYYQTTGEMLTGLQTIEGKNYDFDADGIMQYGWQVIAGKKYYFDVATGAMYVGWQQTVDGKVYCTTAGLATGMLEIQGDTYYFSPETGAMQTGWITLDGTSRYFDTETGVMTNIGHAEVQLDVPDYKQFGESWSDTKIQYSTIGKVGCLVTCLSMKYSAETKVTTPDKMLSKLSFSGDNLLWSSCTDLGYQVDTLSGSLTQAMMQKIYNQLQNGKSVILGGKKSNGGQHYVVITGYTGSTGTSFSASNFVINDPGSSYRFRLDEFVALFPTMYKMIY